MKTQLALAIALALSFFFYSNLLLAHTIRVPGDSTTIQAAINGAVDGDTVLVTPGAYTGPGNKDIELLGKAIVVISEVGPENTIIDCEGSGRGFYIHQNEQQSTLISGFTIINSSTAVDIDSYESPTIDNCIVDGAGNRGIDAASNSNAIIRNCIIRNCSSYGLYFYRAPGVLVQSCLVYNNNNSGIYVGAGDSPPIINCTIYGNNASNNGGGVICVSGRLTMRNCIVWGNTAEGNTPSIYTLASDVTYSIIEGGFQGRGNLEGNPLFINAAAGDFHLLPASPAIDAGSPADAFGNEPQPNGARINIGCYGNTTEATPGDNSRPIIATIEPSEGPPAGGTITTLSGANFGSTPGNLSMGGHSADILLWKPNQIIVKAPAHQAGKATVELTTTEGKTDVLTEGFTYQGNRVLRVSAEFATIQQAIDFAAEGDTVLVAPGAYTGPGNKDIELLGKAIVVISEAGPENTIIDCEGAGRGFYIHQNEQQSTLISGFTIINSSIGVDIDSYASPTIDNCIIDGASSRGIEAASNSNAIIRNCIILNSGSYGLYFYRASGALVQNCLVYNNNNSGIYIGAGDSPPIINCTIYGNNASNNGGGVVCASSRLTMRNCIVWGNTANGNSPSIYTLASDVTYSIVEGGFPGRGNLEGGPLFTNVAVGDFHLQPASPDIDAGSPADAFGKEPQPNGGRINIGCYGNTTEATSGDNSHPIIAIIEPGEGPAAGGTITTLSGANFGSIPGNLSIGGHVADILLWKANQIIGKAPAHQAGKATVELTTNEGKTDVLTEGFTYRGNRVLRVPAEFSTIQKAIDFASTSDTVLVAPGAYTGPGNKDIELLGKAIVVISEAGPENTIIDCEGAGRGFYIHQNEQQSTLISGFTILNSNIGVDIDSYASPTIDNCIIDGATSRGLEANFNSRSIIRNCIARNCNSYGLYLYRASGALVQNCLVYNNNNSGIYIGAGDSPPIVNCTIYGNNASNNGGGVFCSNGRLTMRNSIVWGNTANNSAPSIFANEGNITYSNVEGGWLGEGNIDMASLFVDAPSGDFHLQSTSPCIDTGDPLDDFQQEPAPNGGRINMGYYGNSTEATMGNAPAPRVSLITPAEGIASGGVMDTLQGMNFGSAEGKIYFGDSLATVISWTGNRIICRTPVHPIGTVDVKVISAGLRSAVLPEGFTFTPRLPIRVPEDYLTIQEAIDSAINGDVVLVAAGEYVGNGNKNLEFRGKEIVLTSEAGAEQTIINCEGDGRGVFFSNGDGRAAILRGFTIRNSNSDGIYLGNNASPTIEYCILEQHANQGMYWSNRNAPIVRHCIIRNNGRGIRTRFADADAIVQNCLITGNTTTGDGAGVLCENDAPLFLNCTIAQNSADGRGGGAFGNRRLRMRNCIVWGNTAEGYSGILANEHDVTYSCIEGGWPGTGNIQADPLFANPGGGNFHLLAGSPAIDRGSLEDEVAEEPIPNGQRINMGAYGSTAEATASDANRPVLFSIMPAQGLPAGGGYCTLRGFNFGDLEGSISFGGYPGEVEFWADTLAICAAPAHPSGKVDVRLTNAQGASGLLPSAYTYTGAVVHHVPEDYATIQKAIDFAEGGDTVLVAAGTYTGTGNKELDFRGKAITVTSEEGAAQTIIDCEGEGRGVVFFNGEGRGAVFSGFTIRNSNSDGIYLGNNASPTIEYCILEQHANQGMYWSNRNAPIVRHCIIRNNGRGIRTRFADADAIVQNCLITGNTTTGDGAGVFCENDAPLFLNCTIAQNSADGQGGGAYGNRSLRIRNCIVWGNTADSYPAILANDHDVTYSCIDGGWPGTGNIAAAPLFVDAGAGDFHLQGGSPAIDGGSPADEVGEEPGPNGQRINMGAYGSTAEATVSDASLPVLFSITPAQGPPAGGGYCTLRGLNFGGSEGIVSFGNNPAEIEFWADTLAICAAPAHPSGKVDVRLTNAQGASGLLPAAYTYTGAVVHHVPEDYATIQKAIDFAEGGDTVLVAAGTYTGTGNKELDFKGKAITVISEEGAAYTIIDCEGEGQGLTFFNGEDRNAVFSSFTIRNSNSSGIYLGNGASPMIEGCILERNTGQGMYWSYNNAPLVRHCTITNNGRGIYTRNTNVDAVIQNCVISDNATSGNGAGLYCQDAAPLLLNCTITRNSSESQGGGVYCSQEATLRNCIVWGNTATVDSTANIAASELNITYSNIQGGWPGAGNIDANPVFVNRYASDYHLHPSSPCIDAGDPADDYSLEPQPNGGRINMGAYGNTVEATVFDSQTVILQHFVEPTCEPQTVVTVEGLYLGSGGTASIGTQAIPGEDILLWTDTLVQLFAPTDQVGNGASIRITSSHGTDSIPGGLLFTPRIQYVSGEVSGVWTKDCPGIYVLTDDVVVPEGQSLTIEAGVQVLADTDSTANISFQVLGSLIAEGTATDSILFSSLPSQRTPGAWQGILLESGNSISDIRMNYCIVEYGETGVTAEHSNILIESTHVRDNDEHGVVWLGVVTDASGVLKNSAVTGNGGWGVVCEAVCYDRNGYVRPTIQGNLIENNNFGGIDVRAIGGSPSSWNGFFPNDNAYSEPNIINNIIRYNGGEGINSYANGRITQGTFSIHKSWAYANPRVEGNVIAFNTSSFSAEAPWGTFVPWLSHTSPEIVNNTFYSNGPVAVLAGDSSKVTVINSIFWGEESAGIEYKGGGQTFISHSNFQELQPGEGNTSNEPLFFGAGSNDFRLRASSPCIDAGNNEAVNEPTDFAGAPRIADGDGDGNATVDMGAYEYHLPQITMQPDTSQELCEGETAILSLSAEGGGLSYQWQKDGQDISGANAVELSFANAQPGNSGSYICVVTDELGGSVQTATAQLTVHPLYNVEVQVDASATAVCEGSEVVFTAIPMDAGADPQFEWQVNGQPAGESGDTFTTAGLSDGDLVVCTLTSQEACTTNNPAVSGEVVVEVHPLPEVALEPPEPVCADEPAFELNIATLPGGVYSGPGVSNNHFNPALAGPGLHDISYAYTDTATGCTSLEMTIIRVLEVMEAGVSISSPADSYCAGDEILLTAAASHPGDSPIYQWTVNGEAAGGNSPELPLPGEPGVYEVACTLLSSAACALNNPAMSNVVALEVHALPAIGQFGPESVCVNTGFLELGATPAGGIYDGPGIVDNLFDPVAAGVGVHTIRYTYADPETGCTNTGSADITVEEALEVGLEVAGEATHLCAGDSVSLAGMAINGGDNPVWEWTVNGVLESPGPGLELFNLEAGDYEFSCTLTSSEECTADGPSVSFVGMFIVNPLPEVTLTLPDTIDSASGLVELIGGQPAGGVYAGPGVTQSGDAFFFDPVIAGGGAQDISYTYTDENGCSATATTEVLVGLGQPPAGIRFRVFPNPSGGRFYLRTDQPAEGWVISVFNLQGSKVWEETWLNPAGGEQEVDLRGAPKGAYLLRVTDGKWGYVRRLVVQ